jgi:hypothetical protein
MRTNVVKTGILMGMALLVVSVMAGCTTVIVPEKHGDMAVADENHGLLLGHIRLTREGKDPSTSLNWPINMKWWVEEETTNAKPILISPLPVDGSFVVKLPAGSYRVTGISFDSVRGIWHTSLPTTFSIRPRECTSVGAWALHMRTGFFAGSITRQVSNEQDLPRHEMRGCPIFAAPLESPVKSSVRLNFHTRGSGR